MMGRPAKTLDVWREMSGISKDKTKSRLSSDLLDGQDLFFFQVNVIGEAHQLVVVRPSPALPVDYLIHIIFSRVVG